MKFSVKFLWLVAITILLSSCGDINQEMWLEKDGSGKIEYSVDLGESMPMIAMMLQGAAQQGLGEMENGEDTKAKIDGIMEKISEERLDTTFNLFSSMPDSIKREMTNPEDLKKVNIKANVNMDENIGLLKLSLDFKDFAEIDKLYEGLLNAFSKGRPELANMNIDDVLNGNSFGNNHNFNKKEYKFRMLPQPVQEEGMGEMMEDPQTKQMVEMMFGDSKFIRTTHFPYDVKSVSGMDAKVDGKTVTSSLSIMDNMNNNAGLEMNVKFKKKFLGIF